MKPTAEKLLLLEGLAQMVRTRETTQEIISSETGVHQSQVSRILSGQIRRMSPNALALCKYAYLKMPLRSQSAPDYKSMLTDAVLRAWDGTPKHAQALHLALEALREVQTAFQAKESDAR